jgi:hypothetical protein
MSSFSPPKACWSKCMLGLSLFLSLSLSVYIYTYRYIRMIHTYIQTYMHTYMHTYIYTHTHTHTHGIIHTCMCAYIYVIYIIHVRVFLCVYIYTHIYVHVHYMLRTPCNSWTSWTTELWKMTHCNRMLASASRIVWSSCVRLLHMPIKKKKFGLWA